MKLPLDISCELKKCRHQFLYKSITKSLLFWGASMAALFVIGSRSRLFNMRVQPVWFWAVFAILLVLPILFFKLYRLVTYPEVTGMVSKLENKTYVDEKTRDIRGVANGMDGSEPGGCMICEVTVLDEKGKIHVFALPGGEKADFVQEYYQVGDVVHHPRFARYPFNESRLPPCPFCLCCGYIGATGERKCSNCGAPLVPGRAEKKKKQDAWEYRNGG